VALLGDWDEERAGRLFADNVALDQDLGRRHAAAERLGGPPHLVELRADSRTEATGTIAVGEQRWKLELQLSPQVPPRIQWYELTALDTIP
jgi:hypothetical protein